METLFNKPDFKRFASTRIEISRKPGTPVTPFWINEPMSDGHSKPAVGSKTYLPSTLREPVVYQDGCFQLWSDKEIETLFKDLKQSLGREIAVRPDAQLHHEQFDLMAIG